MNINRPRVAIVNIGAEEEKGNALVKETFPLLKACRDIHFIGSIEAREILTGPRMLLSVRSFCGKCYLKALRGRGCYLNQQGKTGMMADLRSKIGALLVKPALKDT